MSSSLAFFDAPLSSSLDYLFKFGTYTGEKPVIYNGIAWANQSRHGLRIKFEQLNQDVTPHSAIEAGISSLENVLLKYAESYDEFRLLAEGQPHHDEFRKRLKKAGYQYNARRTLLLTEDSTLATRLDVYAEAASHFKGADPRLIYTDSTMRELKGKRTKVDGIEYITIPDGGMIWEAILQQKFFNTLREAAHRLGLKELPILEQVSCAWGHLSSADVSPAKTLTTENLLYLYTPNGVENPIPGPSVPTAINATSYYLCTPRERNRTLHSHWDEHLATECARRFMIDGIVAYLKENSAPTADIVDFRTVADQTQRNPRHKKRHHQKLFAVQVTANEAEGTCFEQSGHIKIRHRSFESIEPFIQALSGKFYSGHKDQIYKTADAVIFGPLDPRNPFAHVRHKTILDAMVVAQTFDRRYMRGVRPVVMNLDGCYDHILAGHLGYPNRGFTKEFIRTPLYERRRPNDPIVTVDGVNHLALGYLEVLSGNDYRRMQMARDQLLEVRLESYDRLEISVGVPDDMRPYGGIPKPEGLYAVTGFSSASSDNTYLNENIGDFSRFLGRNGLGLVMGGFDQHTGEFWIKPYAEVDGEWLAALTTDDIVKIETRLKRLPSECHFWRSTHDFGPRIVDLARLGDEWVSTPGGIGTGHETGAMIVLKLMGSELVKDKRMTLFSPRIHDDNLYQKSVKELELDACLGTGAYQSLLKNRDAFAELGLGLETDRHRLERGVLLRAEEHARRRPAIDLHTQRRPQFERLVAGA